MARVVYMSIFFFKQKTAYEMRISDWSSDVCSSDLEVNHIKGASPGGADAKGLGGGVSKGEAGSRSAYQLPVFCIDAQGSFGGSDSPFCSSSMEMPSGERTKAMWPSRGGRLMMTPPSWRRWQVA